MADEIHNGGIAESPIPSIRFRARHAKGFGLAFALIVVAFTMILGFTYSDTIALGAIADQQQGFFINNISEQSASLYRVVFSLADLLDYVDSSGGHPAFQRLADLAQATLNHARIPEIVDPAILASILGEDPLFLAERLGESNRAYAAALEDIEAVLGKATAEGESPEGRRSLANLVELARAFEATLKERLKLLMQIEDSYHSVTRGNLARLDKRNHATLLEFSLLVAALVVVAILYFLSRLRIQRELEAHQGHLAELVAERTKELALANSSLSDRLAEREILIREVHHRVKNNLAMILGLISLQRPESDSGRKEIDNVLDDLSNRVQAIVTIHERLYKSDNLAFVGFRDYVGSLCETLVETLASPDCAISVDIEACETALPVETLLTIGLLTSEIVTNSMKHAFKGRHQGKIVVRLSEAGDGLRLEVGNDGVPPPSMDVFLSSRTLGSTLVRNFASQLRGSLRYEIGAGTMAIVEFPRPYSGKGQCPAGH